MGEPRVVPVEDSTNAALCDEEKLLCRDNAAGFKVSFS